MDSTDLKKSTSMHWAAFAGAELTLSYLIAWGANLEAYDYKGQTPLHLAVKTHQQHRSSKGVKLLLIKGANRNALDNNGGKPS